MSTYKFGEWSVSAETILCHFSIIAPWRPLWLKEVLASPLASMCFGLHQPYICIYMANEAFGMENSFGTITGPRIQGMKKCL